MLFTRLSINKLVYLQLQVAVYVSTVLSLNLTDGDVVRMPITKYDIGRQYGEVEGTIHTVMSDSIVQFTIENIPPTVNFILFQTHSHLYNVLLSYDQNITPHRYINGTNLGLVEMTGSAEKFSVNFFVHNTNNFSCLVLVAAQAYGKNVPIPGGCNMEFSVQIAPYLQISYNSDVVTVDSQRASISNDPFCEQQSVNQKMYHAYVAERDFSSDTYFATLRNMMSVASISLHAREISATGLTSPLRRIYSAYCGTGSAHAVIATLDGYASVYVPAFTYACDPTTDSCDVLKTPLSKVLCAVVLFVGLLMCLFGHKFFKTEMFLLGCISGGIVAHILLSVFLELNYVVNMMVSVALGAILGVVWLFLWCFCGSPVLSVLLATLTLGFIFTASMFYAGVADYDFVQSDLNFWILFNSLMLIVSLLLIPSNMKANIVSCAVLGAYAFIIPVDHYIGSNLKYIVVNMIRRATVPDFKKAFINPAFQYKDLILTFTWIGLALAGVMVQCCQQRNRPPFPPPPHQNRRRRYRQSQMPIRTSRNTESSPLLAEPDILHRYERSYSPDMLYIPESPDLTNSSNQLSKLRTYLSGLLPPTSPNNSEIRTGSYVPYYDSI